MVLSTPEILKKALKADDQQDQELAVAEDALDSQLAFYKVIIFPDDLLLPGTMTDNAYTG